MNYEGLSKAGKMSFQKTLENYLHDLFLKTQYEIARTEFLDEAFLWNLMNHLFNVRMSNDSFQKWAEEGLKLEENELKTLVFEKVQKMRKKKPTEKQISYYKNLASSMGSEPTIPEDYLLFQANLLLFKEQSKEIRPATEKQIHAIKKLWVNTFGEFLVVDHELTHNEVQMLFEKVESEKKKQAKNNTGIIVPFKKK